MTAEQVRVDHADGLHQRKHRGRTDEHEAGLLECFRQQNGCVGAGRHIGLRSRLGGCGRLEPPDEVDQSALLP